MACSTASNAISSPGFSRLVTVEDATVSEERSRFLCAELEAGNIVFLPFSPIAIVPEHRELLLGRKQSGSAYHKNIAYRPMEDRITGLDSSEEKQADVLRTIMRNFSKTVVEVLAKFLVPYGGNHRKITAICDQAWHPLDQAAARHFAGDG